MTTEKYISDLLYRYECVIIPNFGAFVTNEVSAKVNHFTHTFYPPSKQITFNTHIQNNDGLLANYIATVKNISYSNAMELIENEVSSWKNSLKNESLELENIGCLSLNKEGKIVFEPSNSINYLTSSFGFNSYVSPAVKRLDYQKEATILTPSKESNSKTPTFIKYAATAAILIALGTVGWNQYQKHEYNALVAKAEQRQKKVEKSIQEATFVISNPLPAITLNVTKETYNYHIIAGAFREPENAEKRLKQLLSKGFNAKILGVNQYDLVQVSYESFNDRNEAVNQLHTIQKTDSEDAWLLVQEY